jgi:hypothetical protein
MSKYLILFGYPLQFQGRRDKIPRRSPASPPHHRTFRALLGARASCHFQTSKSAFLNFERGGFVGLRREILKSVIFELIRFVEICDILRFFPPLFSR